MIRTLHEYTVEGHGPFPFDMLRYDTAWPAREAETPLFAPFGKAVAPTRKISLVGLRAPTVARWHSFGWNVLDHHERRVG